MSFFWAFSRRHRELELAPTVKSPQAEIEIMEKLNSPALVRGIQLSFFWAFSRRHRELELAPTVKSPQAEIEIMEKLNSPALVDFSYTVCFNIV